MVESTPDLQVGDLRKLLVFEGDFCYLAGDLWLAEHKWISHEYSGSVSLCREHQAATFTDQRKVGPQPFFAPQTSFM